MFQRKRTSDYSWYLKCIYSEIYIYKIIMMMMIIIKENKNWRMMKLLFLLWSYFNYTCMKQKEKWIYKRIARIDFKTRVCSKEHVPLWEKFCCQKHLSKNHFRCKSIPGVRWSLHFCNVFHLLSSSTFIILPFKRILSWRFCFLWTIKMYFNK